MMILAYRFVRRNTHMVYMCLSFFFFQAEDGIRYGTVTGVQTCALPILNCNRISSGKKIPFLRAQTLQWEFQSYLRKNGIFFPEEIRLQFIAINDLMLAACVEREFCLREGDRPTFEEARKLNSKGRKIVDELQSEIRKRLWNAV